MFLAFVLNRFSKADYDRLLDVRNGYNYENLPQTTLMVAVCRNKSTSIKLSSQLIVLFGRSSRQYAKENLQAHGVAITKYSNGFQMN
jgi:hypothetical protein